MSISRTSMAQQISKPPQERTNASKKVKKQKRTRVITEGQKPLQGMAQRVRFSGAVAKCRKVGVENWGNSTNKTKRTVVLISISSITPNVQGS